MVQLLQSELCPRIAAAVCCEFTVFLSSDLSVNEFLEKSHLAVTFIARDQKDKNEIRSWANVAKKSLDFLSSQFNLFPFCLLVSQMTILVLLRVHSKHKATL